MYAGAPGVTAAGARPGADGPESNDKLRNPMNSLGPHSGAYSAR